MSTFVVGKTYKLEEAGVKFMAAILCCEFKNSDGTFTVTARRDDKNVHGALTEDISSPYGIGKPVYIPDGTLDGKYTDHKVTLVEAITNES